MESAHVSRSVIEDFLAQKRLAIVGVSHEPGKGFGNMARKELAKKGYRLFVVHPTADEIDGAKCYRDLADVADQVDGVVLVTPPAETERLVVRAAELWIRRVWMQQGAEWEQAIRFCEARNLPVVHHECILMFAEPAMWLHRAHRWVKGVSGELPH